MLPGSTGAWHQRLGAFQKAWRFTTYGRPIGKKGRKDCEGKGTKDDGMIDGNKSIPVPHSRYWPLPLTREISRLSVQVTARAKPLWVG